MNRHGKRYIYYRCARQHGKKTCDEKMTRQETLVDSLADLAENVRLENPKFAHAINLELERFAGMERLMRGVRNTKDAPPVPSLAAKDYLRYVLSSGTPRERAEILRGI